MICLINEILHFIQKKLPSFKKLIELFETPTIFHTTSLGSTSTPPDQMPVKHTVLGDHHI